MAGYVWDILKNSEQTGLMAAEYIGKRLAGNEAKYGGDDVNGKPRKFGYIYLSSTPAVGDEPREVHHEPAARTTG